MNIHNDSAGQVTEKHILSRGFEIFDTIEGNDMGQMSYSMPQYKNDRCVIVGGYWHWTVKDNNGNELFGGWWNTDEEFDKTMTDLELL